MVKNPDILSADELFSDLSSKFKDDKELLKKHIILLLMDI